MNFLKSKVTIGTSVGVLGAAVGFKQYTKDVTAVVNTTFSPEVLKLMNAKSELPHRSTLYSTEISKTDVTPQSLAQSMFSSWAMMPEKMLLRLLKPDYQPLSIHEGNLIYGMFRVELNEPQMLVLHWQIDDIQGFQVFTVEGNKANFTTTFSSPKPPSPTLSLLHKVYSKILLAAAVKKN